MAQLPVILVALDGSTSSLNAANYLSRMLDPRSVVVDLFHVQTEAPETLYDPGEIEDAGAFGDEIAQWTRTQRSRLHVFMEKTRDIFLDAGFPASAVDITIQPRRAGVARDIIDRAASGRALVAVGRLGMGTLPEFMLGSIASKLAESLADIQLVIVGGRPTTDKVLVAFDRSTAIRKGFDQAIPLLNRNLAEILLCHIVRPLSVPGTFFTPGSEAHWLDENTRRIVPAMVAVKEQLGHSGFDPAILRTAILKEKTSRAEGLAAQAEALGFGSIVVGRRGMTGTAAFSMGRVTRKILQLVYQRAIWIV